MPPLAIALAAQFLAASLSHTDVNLVLIPRPGAAMVHLAAAIYSGSGEDPPGKEGLASLTLAMIAMDGTGEPLAAAAGKDVLLVSGAAPAERQGPLLDRLAAALVAPALTPERLERARAAQAASLEALVATGLDLASELFDRIAFPAHPYGHPAAGLRASLAAITLEDIRTFHAGHVRRGNVALAAAGPLEGAAASRLRVLLAPLPAGTPARAVRPLSFAVRPRVAVVEAPSISRAHVVIGLPLAVPRAHPDHPGLVLGAELARRAAAGLPNADAGPAAGGCGAGSRRQSAFRLAFEVAPEEAAVRLRDALRALAGLAGGAAPADPAQVASEMAARLAPALAGDESPATCALADLLHRTPGWADRLAALLDGAASWWAETVARHVPIARLTVAVVVPDARTFVRALLSADRSAEIPGWPALAEDEIEVIPVERLIDGEPGGHEGLRSRGVQAGGRMDPLWRRGSTNRRERSPYSRY